jgi:hypothetical protein
MTDTLPQIAQLFPQGKTITLKGKSYTVKPFGFGKFPKILHLLKGFSIPDNIPANAEALTKAAKSVDLGKVIAENSERVMELCSLAINEQAKFFDDLDPDEGIDLCWAIIEVNADFFITRLQPKLLQALSGLTASVGQLLPQDSSAQGTA